ncbi:MAG: deoxyribodipyrimidine photo-lyase, partial [Nanoarchaeota archaeon]|nr:deoxyribodipyrimidine photo-lyase [Nanoarchaeota archaeon]
MHKLAAFIFRRDLRLEDNTGLLKALKESEKVACCFFLDPKVRDSKYFSANAFQFMAESLIELNSELKKRKSRLFVFKETPEAAIKRLAKTGVGAVYVNTDYTPYSIRRDKGIKEACDTAGIYFDSSFDYLLTEPEKVRTGQGTPYKVFTPFYNKAKLVEIEVPKKNSFTNYLGKDIDGALECEKIEFIKNKELYVHGGRKNCLGILSGLKKFEKYASEKDIPALEGTTGLSAHNKFGTCSIREVYYAIRSQLGECELLRQLYWRDFFTYVAYHFPYVFGKPLHDKEMRWQYDSSHLEAWEKGQTGFPIVDAGMRELNATGFMHNRVRMVVASFLTKDLHIDWRDGERYFASKLVDYDPSVNNGNWQWAAGCGVDTKFRIFNPWTQQERFDPEAIYIKRWIPELRKSEPEVIHNIHAEPVRGYAKPIIEHDKERR